MASTSRVYSFTNDKAVSPQKLEIEFSNIVSLWNNHEQGIQAHSIIWTAQLWIQPVIVTAAGPYNAASTDGVIVINQTVGASITVNLSTTLNKGRVVIVKDGKGDANTNNITVAGNGKNIDGAATSVINTAYGVLRLLYNGTIWNVI